MRRRPRARRPTTDVADLAGHQPHALVHDRHSGRGKVHVHGDDDADGAGEVGVGRLADELVVEEGAVERAHGELVAHGAVGEGVPGVVDQLAVAPPRDRRRGNAYSNEMKRADRCMQVGWA